MLTSAMRLHALIIYVMTASCAYAMRDERVDDAAARYHC